VTLPANFGRAIDLSGLGKAPAAVSSQSSVAQVNAANIGTEFLALSRTKPVVIACWSSRSQESMTVVDILAKLQAMDEDRWTLGSLNVDTEAQVAQALQVRTVPYAIALVNEQIVPLFEQSYPEAQIRMVIDKVLSLATEQGLGGSGEEVQPAMEPEEEEALTALEAGDFLSAEAAYKKLLDRKPQDNFAKLGLAQTQLLIRTTALDPDATLTAANASPQDVELQIKCADLDMSRGDVDLAFARLLKSVREFKGPEQLRAKSHLIELFSLIDPTDPRLVKARSALASALY
jgi:putative thioredoxin